ncbi:DUF4974 domain-containing protein [Sphingobacterium sp. DK4209]|uniref:DUF4974 domain-containing protein n=1 Tax=Sphingobacterium zhuxiongii TaxID=2662364 RepID=A0A5Q0QBW7_9SPHI|nr:MULTISPECIES: FecR domain-containing protein [unclassified Sphingobacterium]MVZ66289.1 DUF4974 domain-containing protein [Sphingobacterium sp. DK4209]QGA25072.1 DUF4974 domain-containing protein [Sphingobacterium sp. dk4302]
MPKSDLQIVFDRYIAGISTKEDLLNLLSSLQHGEDEFLKQHILEELSKEDLSLSEQRHSVIVDRVLQNLQRKRAEEELQTGGDNGSFGNEDCPEGLKLGDSKIRRLRRKWFLVAACFLGICLIIPTLRKSSSKSNSNKKLVTKEIYLPSHNEATILFEDGEILSVLHTDSAVLRSRGIEIIKAANKELVFKIHSTTNQTNQKQTFRSPKGMVSQLILSDNTHVLLNSGSQLRYTNSFTQAERRVSLEGEAYFKVSPDKKHPFIVSANETEIKVLGTSFNVSTKQSERQVITTLEEGSVLVKNKAREIRMSPGMQSSSNQLGVIDTVQVNVAQETAWKDGLFKFKGEEIQSVLEKLQAWYAIESVEIDVVTSDRFTGTIKRTRQLSDVLQNLEKISNYKFQIKDRRIIVSKNQ